MKKIIKLAKKLIIGTLILYSYNMIAVSFNLIIPINLYTILLVSFLDIPAIILLTFSLKLIF